MDAAAVASVVETAQEYLRHPAVVGHEEPFFAHLAADLSGLGCTVERRRRLLVAWRGAGTAATLSCHIDRHGLVGTGDGEYEYAAFVARLRQGEEDFQASRAALERIRDRFLDEPVVAYASATGAILATGVIGQSYFCGRRLNLVFRVDGFEALPVGTPVAFAQPCQLDGELVTGQLDNVVSAAIAHALFAAGFEGRALFTAEEEIGRSWAIALEYLQRGEPPTRELLVLDTSPFPDDEAIRSGRVVLRRRDAHGEFNAELVARLEAACTAAGIPYLVKDEWIAADNAERQRRGERPGGLGSTELGRIVEGSGGRVNGATLQLPTFGYHSNRETTSRRALGNLLALLGRILGLVGLT